MKKSAARDRPAPEKPRQPGRIRAFFLAVLVHAAFFALIVFGITWQSSPTAPYVAEIWEKLPSVAKPEPAPAEPVKPPEPEPAKPPPEPEPAKPPPEPPKPEVKPEPPKPDPAIAEKLEREKREQAKREKLEREREEKRKKEEARKQKEQEEAARKKQKDQEEAARKKAEDDKRRRDEEKARREAEKAREAAAAGAQAEMNRYVDAIKAKIRGKANVPDNVTGMPEVHVRLRILPGGEVLDATITRPSGNPAYDRAIERAIRSASPLPVPPPDSELFPRFRDLILNIQHDR